MTFGWLQKLNPGYEICIISYQVNLSSEVSAMFNSLMPSLNSRSLPFVVFLGGCQNLSSGAIRPGGLLFLYMILNKNRLSRKIKKPESVDEKRVQYFCIVPRVRFLFKNRKSVHFCTDFNILS